MTMNLLSIGLLATHVATASPGVSVPYDPTASDGVEIIRVAADCSAAAAQVVRTTGGQLLSASLKNGTCVISVLVPGKGNERPKKVTVSVPQ